MSVKRLLATIAAALALAACSNEQDSSEYLVEGENLTPTIAELPDIKGKSGADPATVGLYNVSIECAGNGQTVSFRISTQGKGALNVKAEEHKSVGAKTLYARQVEVNDQNRDQVELNLHQFSAPNGVGVFIQIVGGSGVAASDELTLDPAC